MSAFSVQTATGPAAALKSATTSVDVAAATAPSAGQYLVATDSTHATWQTAAPGGIGGSTGATDNVLLRADGTGGATAQNSVIVVDDTGLMSGVLSGRKVNAGGSTLNAADSGKTVSIVAGGGADSLTLPNSPSFGVFYRFAIIGTDTLTINAQGSNVIYIGASASSAAGSASSGTKGSFLYLEYVAANLWFGIASGTWALA